MSLDPNICMAAFRPGDVSFAPPPWTQIMRRTGCLPASGQATCTTRAWLQRATVRTRWPLRLVPEFSMRKTREVERPHAADRSFSRPSEAVNLALTIAAQAVRLGGRLASLLVHQESEQ